MKKQLAHSKVGKRSKAIVHLDLLVELTGSKRESIKSDLSRKGLRASYSEDIALYIAKRIENEMQYPGQIKVMVIRETRQTAIAK